MLLQSYLIGISTALLSFYLVYSWKRRRLYRMASKIPGPKGLPFFGEALSVFGNDHSKAFKSLTGLAKDYDTPSKIWYGPYCAVILDKPKDLQIVLNSSKCLDKAEVYKFVGITNGLLVSGGNLWRTHRKLLDPSFNVSALQSLLPTFNAKAKILVHQMKKRVSVKEFDCYTQISACTLESLLKTMFGIERDAQSNADSDKYLHDMDIGSKLLNDRLYKIWFHFQPLFRISDCYQRYMKYVINGMYAIGDEIIKEKTKQRNEKLPDEKGLLKKQISNYHNTYLIIILQKENTKTSSICF